MRFRFLPDDAPSLRSPFFIYLMVLLFVTLGDSTMSYTAPVIMEHTLGSASKMGLILAASSSVGILMDFLFAKTFGTKKAIFFDKIFFSLVFLFPLTFLVWKTVPSFIFSMVVWGVYFEALVFSNYHIIHEYVHPKNHAWAWGMLSFLKNIAWVIGPFLAGKLGEMNWQYPLIFSFSSFGIGLFVFIAARTVFRTHHHVSAYPMATKQRTFPEELKIWKRYVHVLWPLLGLLFMFSLIDSTFFSIGPVFGEDLAQLHPMGGLLISAYTIPGLIFGVLTGVICRPFGKKRAVYFSGILAGMGLLVMSQLHSIPLMIFSVFCGSAGLALFYPSLCAVFEDYVARAGHFGNDMIGLTAVMGSIGYVVGPVVNGILADHIGAQKVFGLWGMCVLVLSLVSLLIVKRKVKLPHREIEQIVSQETIVVQTAS